jgi:mono/diheme cytochrome c family protein
LIFVRFFAKPAIPLAGLALAATLNFGCQSLTSTAPAVSPAMAESAKDEGFSAEQLAAGRNLLLMRCISCHSLVPISKYPAQRWPELVASMSERAGLNEIQRAQITAYLVAARKSLP